MDLHAIRQEYSKKKLSKNQCVDNPIEQFQIWLQEAFTSKVHEPTAMNVATVGADGKPQARMVLLKEVNEQGFVFFTNYASRKGQAIETHPFVALTFFWAELERQVRVEGAIFKLPENESDAYFASRPYQSRLGAWASEQSSVIDSKTTLVTRAALFATKYPLNVPRPSHWGGYVVEPQRVEFWQGRPSRLHDRIEYLQKNDQWVKHRLAP